MARPPKRKPRKITSKVFKGRLSSEEGTMKYPHGEGQRN